MQPPTRPVSIVTGAGSGIGLQVVRQLTDAGHAVALVGRDRPKLESAATHCGEHALIIPGDVASAPFPAQAVQQTLARFGRIDALICNAGWAQLFPIDKTTDEVLDACFGVNTLGPARFIRACWPIFQRQRAGRIVCTSSMATADPFPGFFAYAASKAAIELMVRSCNNEGSRSGIEAYAVAPGAVETPMLRSLFSAQQLPPARALDPAEVARVMVACVQGKRTADAGNVIRMPSP